MPPLFGERFMRHAGYPIFTALKSRARGSDWWPMRRLRLFERLGHADPEVWRAYRNDQLRRLLDHALREIPFYADLPRSLADLIRDDPMAALCEFPVVTKRDMQERGDDLIANDVPRRRRRHVLTGGSTSERTRFWIDRRRDTVREMGAFRLEMNAGWRLGEPVGLVWSRHSEEFLWTGNRLVCALMNLARMHPVLDHFDLTPERMRAYLAALERVRPSMLRGFASSIHEFARFLEENDLCERARAVGLRGVVTTCEMLLPLQRKRIEQVFGTRAFDLYASREAHVIAMECPAHDGLHVHADNVVLELLDEAQRPVPPGVPGRVAVTDLWNFGYATIRVDLADVATWHAEPSPCACGMTFPRLASVEGRVSDFMTLPDGTRVHGFYYLLPFARLAPVRHVLVEQEAIDRVLVRIVGDRNAVAPLLPEALAKLPRNVSFDIRYADEIPVSPMGKYRWMVSHVPPGGTGDESAAGAGRKEDAARTTEEADGN